MRLATYDELVNVMSVSYWTPLLLTSYDTYLFSDLFIAPVLKDFGVILDEPLTRFSQI